MQEQPADVVNLVLPDFSPFTGFAEASRSVLNFLNERLGFGLWMVTRTNEDDWIVLDAEDRSYDVSPGDVFSWSDSMCSRMVTGAGPNIASDVHQVESYVNAPIASQMPIGAYVGLPLTRKDGTLYGTLCGIDKAERPDGLNAELPLLTVLARTLSTLLDAELRAQVAERDYERSIAEAETSTLTGAYNRRGWERLLASEEARCKRYGHKAVVAMIDLDGLKKINDQSGHAAGDQLIRKTAETIKAAVREGDVVARLGGDEFGVLAPELSGDDAAVLMRRIDKTLSEAGISASLGWAVRDPRSTLEAAIKVADKRMYIRKRQRKAES